MVMCICMGSQRCNDRWQNRCHHITSFTVDTRSNVALNLNVEGPLLRVCPLQNYNLMSPRKDTQMLTSPRNFLVSNVELNWARLDQPVSPFGAPQWELQIATTDKAVADDLKANHMNVKERDGKFYIR